MTPIIDAQLHEPSLFGDWKDAPKELQYDVMTESTLSAMHAVGVDGALLFALDLDWGRRAAAQHPDRFWIVPMFSEGGIGGAKDADAPDVEEWVEQLKAEGSLLATRIMSSTSGFLHGLPAGAIVPHSADRYSRVIAVTERLGLPLFASTAGAIDITAGIARDHPELVVVADHLAIPQPPTFVRDEPPFMRLDDLLAGAQHPNLMVKISGAPTLSLESYPFGDLWAPLLRIIDAYGPERVMWGTDISRVTGRAGFFFDLGLDEGYSGFHRYAEALHYFLDSDRLDATTKELVLGGNAARLIEQSGLTPPRGS
jgi:predicted TIM-barrel fold metal-dependent hydrolase